MGFIEFIKHKLIGRESIEISGKTFEEFLQNDEAYSKFHLTEIALFTAVDMIARTAAKCEFVTVENHREVQHSEYYLWNYRPNKHQSKTEFITEAVARLILQNELLIFETSDGQLLIADSFARNERAVLDDVFTNVFARGLTFTRPMYERDVLYLRYNNGSVRNLLTRMCAAYGELMQNAAERYSNETGHKVVLELGTTMNGDKAFNDQLNEWMNQHVRRFFSEKNAVLPLYKGFKYTEPTKDAKNKAVSEVNDLKQLKAEAMHTVGNALHIPPAVIEGDASMLSDAMTALIGNAVEPIVEMFAQEITEKRYGEKEFRRGSYLTIDTTWARHIDAIHDAVNIDKAIACGVINPHKAQRYCHQLPCDEAWAKEYYITKNYQNAQSALKGGDE
jgi:HK97 family phage portal protein